MRVLFMGTSQFAIPALEQLINNHYEILGVVTQPDRPSGRGKKLTPPPIKKIAAEYNLNVYQPEKVRESGFVKTLSQLSPDVIIVAAFGQLLPKSVLDIPPCGVINLHPSLLPKYRGAAPIQWALINGEKETGITLMLLDVGEDTGDIICSEKISINFDDTVETLQNRLAGLGASLLVEVLRKLPHRKRPAATPQNHDAATHAPRLTKTLGQIDWGKSATTIHNLIRGTYGWPGAYSYFREKILIKIIQAIPHEKPKDTEKNIHIPIYGTINITPDKKLFVTTGEGELQLISVQPATKKIMDVADFVNGYQVKNGETFSVEMDNTRPAI